MSKKKTKEEFISEANIVHNNFYNYEKVDYINNATKVIITCPIHGDFPQKPNSHLSGQGCPKCSIERNKKNKTKSFDKFKEEANKIHGNFYRYDESTYSIALQKMRIECPIHGEFWQTPAHHLSGCKCPKCALISKGNKRRSTKEDFITSSRKIHGGKYDYSNVDYKGNKTAVEIKCPQHGPFMQRPNDHLDGKGCPRCANNLSKAEDEIYNYLVNIINIDGIIRHDREVLNGLEIDILIPQFKLGIEFNGLYWHTEDKGKGKYYHVSKTELAESKGYHLIQIFEDEWIEHKDIVLNKLKHFVHKDEHNVRIGARKCQIKEIDKYIAKEFLNEYHIQGFANSSVYMAAYYENELLGVMTFLKESKDGKWNLNRYASKTCYLIPGLANKLFKHFVKSHIDEILEIKSFLDRRWSHGNSNVYDKMGFVLTDIEKPDYRYFFEHKRQHKFGFRKQILHKKYGLPLTMNEREMTKEIGAEKIWDCGLYKYVWVKNSL